MRSASVSLESVKLVVPSAEQDPRCEYPEPQYTMLFTIVAPAFTDEPGAKLHSVLPLVASNANMVGAVASTGGMPMEPA